MTHQKNPTTITSLFQVSPEIAARSIYTAALGVRGVNSYYDCTPWEIPTRYTEAQEEILKRFGTLYGLNEPEINNQIQRDGIPEKSFGPYGLLTHIHSDALYQVSILTPLGVQVVKTLSSDLRSQIGRFDVIALEMCLGHTYDKEIEKTNPRSLSIKRAAGLDF